VGQKHARRQRAGCCARPREKIEELLSKLKLQFGAYIREQNIEWLDPQEEFDRFSIV